ncbi:MAG: chromate efflux transporter [Pseudomonadota bacterium]
MTAHLDETTPSPRPAEVFRAFLALGLTSFGGPTAHIGYFRTAFVDERRWLTAELFARYFAFAQVLPGPTSSQLGMLIGLHRAGLGGMGAAWVAFTLPSALLMVAAGLIGLGLADQRSGWLIGLAAAAVGVVAHAVWSMATTLLPDGRTRLLAALGFVVVALMPGALGQLLTLAVGGIGGFVLLAGRAQPMDFDAPPLPKGLATFAAVGFATVLVFLVVAALVPLGRDVTMLAGILYSGTFIVGGGHVVLPLLDGTVVQPGFVDRETFLAGYGVAQAMPGPLFSIGAFLGAAGDDGNIGFALLCLVAIFLPSTLLMAATLPAWHRLQSWPAVQPALAGMAAAVTGLLAAALVVVLVPEAITSPGTAAIAMGVTAVVFSKRLPAWLVVLAAAIAGALLDGVGWLR